MLLGSYIAITREKGKEESRPGAAFIQVSFQSSDGEGVARRPSLLRRADLCKKPRLIYEKFSLGG